MNRPRPNALTAKLPEPIHSTSVLTENGVRVVRQVWRTSYSLFSHRVEFCESSNTSGTYVVVVTGDPRLILNPGTVHVAARNVTLERVTEIIKEHLGYDVTVTSMVK